MTEGSAVRGEPRGGDTGRGAEQGSGRGWVRHGPVILRPHLVSEQQTSAPS